MSTRTSVVVLAYGDEPYLEECLEALARELGENDELLLVDNGITPGTSGNLALPARVQRLGDGHNLGFAGGCNFAARQARGDVLVFVNSDAIVRPGSLMALTSALADPSTGIASACLRLADEPDKINSAGNPLNYLGITWAGGCGEPASAHQQVREVAVGTGGFFALRREVWDALGGFNPQYFAYHEDTDLSLRCWMAGWTVRYIPDAVADHHYEFGRNPRKMYLLERNRLITVLTDYPRSLLLVVLPILLAMEPLFLVLATLQGWPREKLRSWGWVLTHVPQLRRRRSEVQQLLRVDDSRLAGLMTSRIEPPMVAAPPGMGAVNAVLSAYWAVARRAITRWGTVRDQVR